MRAARQAHGRVQWACGGMCRQVQARCCAARVAVVRPRVRFPRNCFFWYPFELLAFRVAELNCKPAHAVPNWQALASTGGRGRPSRSRRWRVPVQGARGQARLGLLTPHRALRRMAGLVFLLVFWVLAGACQRHGVGGFYCTILLLQARLGFSAQGRRGREGWRCWG